MAAANACLCSHPSTTPPGPSSGRNRSERKRMRFPTSRRCLIRFPTWPGFWSPPTRYTLTESTPNTSTGEAHYILEVKNSQYVLRDRIASQTWSTRPIRHAHREKSHGRTLTWALTAQPAQDWIEFPHAAQVIRLTRGHCNHKTGHDKGTRVRNHLTACRRSHSGTALRLRSRPPGNREPAPLGPRRRLR